MSALPITSTRLRLRRLCIEDMQDFLAYRTDPEIARLQGWDIISHDQALDFLSSMSHAAHFIKGAWFQVGVALLESDQLIGDVGICIKESEEIAEIGYSIHGAHHGIGYGTEAVHSTIDYIFAASHATQIVAHADVRNIPSWKVLERVGMTRHGVRACEYKGEACEEYMYSISKESKLTTRFS